MNEHGTTIVQEPGSARNHNEILVGDENFEFVTVRLDPDDLKVTAAEIAMLVGKHPVDKFVILQHLKSGELETLRPTEPADLRPDGPERFFVIEGFKTNRFTVSGLSMEWPRDKILARNIKFLANATADDVLVLRREGVDNEFTDDEWVHVGQDGLEEFTLRKKPKLIHVTYKETTFELERGDYTPEQLASVFGVPAGYVLDYIDEHGGFHELPPGKPFKVKDGMEFSSHPPHGQSS
jgi:hypothetical protein